MSYKPYYGAINSDGLWWDGKDWRKLKKADNGETSERAAIEKILMQLETLREHEHFNCHTDGVFKCPRCRRMHFIPDQFDYLCDGCVSLLNTHPNTSDVVKRGLAEWAAKRAKPFGDEDIMARVKERDRLWAIQTTEIIPPLSTSEGRKYVEALPPPSPALNGKIMRIGFWTSYTVYRCHWNEREPEKSGWSFLYQGEIK